MTFHANDEKLVADAHAAVTAFVNGQQCKSRSDVERVLYALSHMCLTALDVVTNGTMEKAS